MNLSPTACQRLLAEAQATLAADRHRDLDEMTRLSRVFADVYRWETGRDIQVRHDGGGRLVYTIEAPPHFPVLYIPIESIVLAADVIAIHARIFSDLEIAAGLHPAWRR